MKRRIAIGLVVATVLATPFSIFSIFPMQVTLADDSQVTEAPTLPSTSLVALPSLVDEPVPAKVTPSLSNISADRPKPYKDRCHTQQDMSKSESSCIYGNLKSKTKVVLFGDSHALSWFPAIERLVIAKKWKLVSLTMSSCWPADILAWNSTKNALMPNCTIWREEAFQDILAMKPSIIFVAGTKGFSTVDGDLNLILGADRTTTWEAGMMRTLDILKEASKRVIYLSDTPVSTVNSATCLQAHLNSIAACATPYAKAVSLNWLAEEHHVATIEGITWVDPTPWICSTNPCSPLSGKYVIYVDGGHLTATFAWTLEKPLWTELTTTP